MTASARVRASRDGDWFHYYWAALRSLSLLEPGGDLVAIQVEGVPPEEQTEGEEVIDLAEYFGGPDAATCDHFRYIQLKHSTMRTELEITSSELRTTLEKFSMIYRAQVDLGRQKRMSFEIVANRCLNEAVSRTLSELCVPGTPHTHATEAQLIRRYVGLEGDEAAEGAFFQCLTVRGGERGLAELEVHVHEELQQYLPGGGTGTEMTLLRESVARRATSLANEQRMEKADVLHSLRTSEKELFPAPNSIENISSPVPTANTGTVVEHLTSNRSNKFLITAVGGVGKSVLTTVLGDALPKDSVTIVYDCFAGGDYRKLSSQRHEHRTGLTQIANELAVKGLCVPLIPTTASVGDYMSVFMRRVRVAAARLQNVAPDALLTVVIDAADNAAMAADEAGQRTFVRDLFREDWPPNARLVQLCRPERKNKLDLPASGVVEIELDGFGLAETKLHLATKFPEVSEGQAAEFLALSDGNPRVQAMAMENAVDVEHALSAIQIAQGGVGLVLDAMLERQIDQVADDGHLSQDELAGLCTALSALPPPVPLEVLGELANLDPNAIRSFAVALGRGLHVTESAIQFRDEPTETWFRTRYNLTGPERVEFTTKIRPVASRSSYAAMAQPQLMFEAEMYDELVELALSESGLPGDVDDLHTNEIARERAKFALGAMMRRQRLADASLLAVRAGELSSGHSRKLNLFRSHSDLAARFLGDEVIESLTAGRDLTGDWPGSNLHVEAAMMSARPAFQSLARGRMRSSVNNLIALLRVPEVERQYRRDVSADDVADLALAAFNLEGPVGAFKFLTQWRPKRFVSSVATKVLRRLADAGRYQEIQHFIRVSSERRHLMVAAVEVLYRYNVPLDDENSILMVDALARRNRPFKQDSTYANRDFGIAAVVWSAAGVVQADDRRRAQALVVLDRCLPDVLPDYVASRSMGHPLAILILGFALRAQLKSEELTISSVSSDTIRKALEENEHSRDSRTREYVDAVSRLLPWAKCWVKAILPGDRNPLIAELQELTAGLPRITDYNTPYAQINGIAEIGVRVLAAAGDATCIDRFSAWYMAGLPWLSASRGAVVRIGSRSPHLEPLALAVVTQAHEAITSDKTDADTRIDDLIALARTILAANPREAEALFNAAVQNAERVGDDLHARWRSLIITAKCLSESNEPGRAYRLFQIGEHLDRSIDLHVAELGEAIHHLDPDTYFTATSRARDRRTLKFEQMLEAGFAAPTTRGSRLAHLALYAFGPSTGWRRVVNRLVQEDERALGARVLGEFTRFEWTETERRRDTSPGPSGLGIFEEHGSQRPAISDQFANCDFTTADGWNEALEGLGWKRDAREELARFALSKHSTRRPELIDALSACTRATASDIAIIARTAAETATLTIGLRDALTRLAQIAAARFAPQFCTYDSDGRDLVAIADACGVDLANLRGRAFGELGQSAHQLSYRDYFYLAARLSERVTSDEAGATFDALASLFDELAPADTSGDGADVPARVSRDVARIPGLIWTALGDTAMETRWRAAHSVLLLVKLGCQTELQELLGYANGAEDAAPFVDRRLPFYALHARMWLLLALARAGHEDNRSVLAGFTPWLASVVRGPHHAVNQRLAQQALARLVDGSEIESDADVTAAMTVRLCNPAIELSWRDRGERANPLAVQVESADSSSESDDRVEESQIQTRFFFDYEDYWCSTVAEVFGATDKDVVRRASTLARSIDGYELWEANEDPRQGLNVYGEDSTYPYKGTWPRQDSLSFYIAVHSLFSTAGELAASARPYKDPGNPHDSYADWLNHFLPTSANGRWLADRRDSPPIPSPDADLADASVDLWTASISRQLFAERAGVGHDWITVASSVDTDVDRFSEDVYINSALVHPDTGRSLLLASMTSETGPDQLHLPRAEDDFDRPRPPEPFALVPWLSRRDGMEGIDANDPIGAGVRVPPAMPAPDIVTRFSLQSDPDCRAWTYEGVLVLRSRVWRNRVRYSQSREVGTDGELLEVSRDFLLRVLRETGFSLVLQVELRRGLHREYYERKKDDEFDWFPRSCDIFLLDQGGTWFRY